MSKRSVCITLILLAILLALPFSFSFAKEWPVVGANPTTTAAWVTLNKMDLDPSVVSFTQNNFPESTWVVKGMVFNEMSEGIGVIKRNVRVTFDSSKALVWHTGNVDVYYVLLCNNVGWKSACNAGAIAPPAADSVVTPLAPREAATEFLPGFPDWFKALMMILIGLIITLLAVLILWLLWRGLVAVNDSFRNRNVPPRPETPLTEEQSIANRIRVITPPAPPTGPTPPAPPTPSHQSDLDKLNELVETYKRQQEALGDTRKQIFDRIGQMREESAQRAEALEKIEQMLKS